MSQVALSVIAHVGPGLSRDALPKQALEAFDSLRPGEHITLELDRPPRELLTLLQEERKGQFDWTPTREGPRTWEVEVSRREAERGTLRSVNDALSWDHDRLDALEARAFASRDRGNCVEAASVFSEFAHGLRRHIRFEEEILFPEFEVRAGFSAESGPTMVMRDEHREILTSLERIEKAMGDPAVRVESLRHGLHLVLGNHNLKEETIVYPLTDRALTPAERDALVARIQAL